MKRIRWDIILLCISLISFIVFGIISYNNYKLEKNAFLVRDELKKINVAAKNEDTIKEKNNKENSDNKKGDVPYSKLYERNSDMIGWLNIPNTNIDYPVMQTIEDEEYYLYRDFFGNNDKNGTLFMDADSDLKKSNSILMIHGHHMKSGDMFGNLSEFLDKAYCEQHSQIYFYVRDKLKKYDIISVFKSKIYNIETDDFCYYNYFSLEDEAEFEEYYKNIKEISEYDTGVTAEYGDEFIVLSTCSYHTKNGRLVVVGKKVE